MSSVEGGVLCARKEENLSHLLIYCHVAVGFWTVIATCLRICCVLPCSIFFLEIWQRKVVTMVKNIWDLLPRVLFWLIRTEEGANRGVYIGDATSIIRWQLFLDSSKVLEFTLFLVWELVDKFVSSFIISPHASFFFTRSGAPSLVHWILISVLLSYWQEGHLKIPP